MATDPRSLRPSEEHAELGAVHFDIHRAALASSRKTFVVEVICGEFASPSLTRSTNSPSCMLCPHLAGSHKSPPYTRTPSEYYECINDTRSGDSTLPIPSLRKAPASPGLAIEMESMFVQTCIARNGLEHRATARTMTMRNNFHVTNTAQEEFPYCNSFQDGLAQYNVVHISMRRNFRIGRVSSSCV